MNVEEFQNSIRATMLKDAAVQEFARGYAESLADASSASFINGFSAALEIVLEKVEDKKSQAIVMQIARERGLLKD